MIELNSFICGDCMDYLPQFPDKHFELAIIDPPYGIGEDGSKNKTRGKQDDFGRGKQSHGKFYSKDYKPYDGGDIAPPMNILENCLGYQKTGLYGVQITL